MIEGEASSWTPEEAREAIREGRWRRPTAGLCPGYTQVNLVILPAEYTNDFRTFCQRNPKPCPLLEELPRGQSRLQELSKTADVRRDLGKYRLFQGGTWTEVGTLQDIWRDDLVSFLIGCSFTFEQALSDTGLPIRHIEEGRNVPMYITNIPCEGVGAFQGKMVVSMRPIPNARVEEAYHVTEQFPQVHGGPVHAGAPEDIGIKSLTCPDFGDSVHTYTGETPVFWACGVTPQLAIAHAKPPFAITHSPGYMLITDTKNSSFQALRPSDGKKNTENETKTEGCC
ncbi:MAG: DUF1445 domain-containing protein [Deltaproteobacteria bacterium]|nr:DUF1445 domain-containing protein [Deltaproteobacteria bacterium]MBU50810.1 DUF1445 domain-containing protein [Deltaproteobacteria bacterium]